MSFGLLQPILFSIRVFVRSCHTRSLIRNSFQLGSVYAKDFICLLVLGYSQPWLTCMGRSSRRHSYLRCCAYAALSQAKPIN